MVNAVDLAFVKDSVNLLVQPSGTLKVMPEGFFNDDVRPAAFAAVQSGLPQLLDSRVMPAD